MTLPVRFRWFGVLVRKAGGLEPHGVGPIRGINASETCVKGNIVRRGDYVTFGRCLRWIDATPRPNPLRFEPTSLANRHPEPAAAQGHMPLVSRESRSPTHGTQTGFQTPLMAIKHMIITARRGGLGPEPPQGPRGVAPCPGFSAARRWGALKPSLSHFSRFSQIRHPWSWA